MRKDAIIFFLFSTILLYISCENFLKNDDKKDFKSPREYTWMMDTISYSELDQTHMYDIWASSPQDVYVVGHCSSPGPGTMWHYDGQSWSTTGYHAAEGGPIQGAIELYDVFGFSSKDVWAAGEWKYRTSHYSVCAHYNGQSWEEIGQRVEGTRFLSVWGSSPDDIWCGGVNGIYHLEGGEWQAVEVPRPSMRIEFRSMVGFSSQDIYAIGVKADVISPIDSTYYDLYHYDGNNWTVIDSTVEAWDGSSLPHFGYHLKIIGGELYSTYENLYRYEGHQWVKLLEGNIRNVTGTARDNLFACGRLGTAYHYNGSDWQQLVLHPDFNGYFTEAWTNGKELFVPGKPPDIMGTIVFHGK